MDLSALITRGFAVSDRILWLLMVERGACSGSELSPDDWYPVSPSAEAARREAAGAIAVCAGCPVREECLELALRNWAVGQHGVWGGTVPAERERLRAARVAQLTRVLARNRYADLAASRTGDRAASLPSLRGGGCYIRMMALPCRPPWRSSSSTRPAASRSTVEPMRAVIVPSASICPTVVSP
jgi:WhiB family redox-sensing transcriptional regulator